MISLFETPLDNNFDILKQVYLSKIISSGKVNDTFERLLKTTLQIKNLFTVNSGTSALHLSLLLSGIKRGDEVILSPQTFIATGLAILYCGAIPVFCDIDYLTGNIDKNKIQEKITEKTKAIICIHWGGYPCDIFEINQIAKRYSLKIIEDAAHALGTRYKNLPIGNLSDFTAFSLQAIKGITTGDGGLVGCRRNEDDKHGKKLRWFGIDRENDLPDELGERVYNLEEVGYKYHLSDINATIGILSIEHFNYRQQKRQDIANYYQDKLKNISGLQLMKNEKDRKSSNWLFPILVENRSDFIHKMQTKNIPVSIIHRGIDHNNIFGSIDYSLVGQRYFDKYQIHLPITSEINGDEMIYIVDTIKEGW